MTTDKGRSESVSHDRQSWSKDALERNNLVVCLGLQRLLFRHRRAQLLSAAEIFLAYKRLHIDNGKEC